MNVVLREWNGLLQPGSKTWIATTRILAIIVADFTKQQQTKSL
jgi:hypothetical protein